MADRYRGWVVLVWGLGLYTIIVSEEEIARSLPDQRYGFVPALALLPAFLLARKYLPRFRRFVLGPSFQRNPIVSESAMNLVWAALAISFPASLLAIATFLNIWDIPFVAPFAAVAIFFIRRSNYFAHRVSWNYAQVPRNGRLHGRRGPTVAYKVLIRLGIAVLIPAVVGSALMDLGYRSDLLSEIVVSTLGWAFLLGLLAAALRFLTRSGTRFEFTEPEDQNPRKET